MVRVPTRIHQKVKVYSEIRDTRTVHKYSGACRIHYGTNRFEVSALPLFSKFGFKFSHLWKGPN